MRDVELGELINQKRLYGAINYQTLLGKTGAAQYCETVFNHSNSFLSRRNCEQSAPNLSVRQLVHH